MVHNITISGEVLVRPGVGIAVAGDTYAVEVAGCEGGVDHTVGVFAVWRGVESVHPAILAPD